MSLRDRLAEWTDWDGAEFELGVCLGLFPPGTFLEHKGIFWASSLLGESLHETLLCLVRAGVLEREDEKFRWAPNAGRTVGR
jgi:hypothetical protein